MKKILKWILAVLGVIALFILVTRESEMTGNILSDAAGGALAVVNGIIDIFKAVSGG